jgi:Glycosyl transferase family 64 domain
MEAPQARSVVTLSSIRSSRPHSAVTSDSGSATLTSATRWDVPNVVRRLMAVADPRHPALSSSHFLMRPDAQILVQSMVPVTPVDFRITIMTYRRFDNALRVLKTLATEIERERSFASDGVSVSIVLMVDFDPNVKEELRQMLRQNATSVYPDVQFDFATSHRGLKASWLDGWKPTTMDSFNLVLEDDLDISAKALRSSVGLIRSVYYGRQYPFSEILGISLFNEKESDVALAVSNATFNLITNSDTLRQSVCSWGVILAAPGWRDFVSWVNKKGKNFDPVLKDSLSNRWPVSVSWKKLALRFAAEKSMYMYYPRFPQGESLVRKLVLSGGTNDKGNIPDQHEDLVVTNRDVILPSDALSVPRLDYKLEPVSSKFASFDGCTMVMPICHRLATIPKMLEHYASVPFKAQIIVVQQPCGGSHQTLNIPDRINNVPIVLKQMPSNDMNNRYLNFEEIMYDCVINLDDDVMHPVESMHQLVRLWSAHFFDYYVGWYPQGRIHVIDQNMYVYKNHSWVDRFDGISSMLLPSGSVYHRRFLDAYNSEPNRPARDVVSNLLNCDDVLMNFVIANATDRGPVIVDDWTSLKRSAELKALSENMANAQWKSPEHMNKRTQCLNEFLRIYGRMPLRYSTVTYKYDKSVAKYPVRVPKMSAVRYKFSGLVPNRNTMHDVADLCNHSGLNPFLQNMTCPSTAFSS